MDISALVHRHAEAVVIHACRIRHIYLLCFALMTFLFPRQLGAMDDSDDDEEMQLINDVALLDSQLEAAGCPCKEKMYAHKFLNFHDKPLAKRLKLWRFRKELRKNLVAEMLSRSAPSASSSGEAAATSPPVIKQETERKRKFEEPPFVNPILLPENTARKPKLRYIEHLDGSAPLMLPLHVAFAAKSVELLRKHEDLSGPQLIMLWNQENANGSITDDTARRPKAIGPREKRTISLITATLK